VSDLATLWTIGHSNHSFEHFLHLLQAERIEFVVDVRSYPYSRIAPHFNREELRQALETCDVQYLFLGAALGGRPSDEYQYDAEGHALYGPMSREPAFVEALDGLERGAREHRIALLCSEGQPHDCHRRLLVGKVLAERRVELRHILPDGSVHQERSVSLNAEGQDGLFGEDESLWRSTRSVSRKRRLSASSAG
jgi:uncharacterized protein (DUF488 family)